MHTKIFALLLTCLFVVSAKAQPSDAIVIDAGKAKNIVIAPYLKVMLVQASSGSASVSLNEKAAIQLKITADPGSLHIEAQKGFKGGLIYLVIENINSLTLGSNALVQTSGILSSPEIDVYVNTHSKAVLRTKGIVNGYALESEEVDVKRSSIK